MSSLQERDRKVDDTPTPKQREEWECPFCGADEDFVSCVSKRVDHWVECHKCRARGPVVVSRYFGSHGEQLDPTKQAWRAWDRLRTSVDVVAAVRRDDDGMVWLCKRNSDGAHAGLAGMWEYPGGKVEDGEQLREALVREILEEFPGCVVNVGRVLDSITSVYEGTAYRVTFFEVTMTQVTAHPTHEKVRWFTPDEACALDHLPSGTVFNARHLASPEEPVRYRCAGCGDHLKFSEVDIEHVRAVYGKDGHAEPQPCGPVHEWRVPVGQALDGEGS